MWSKRIGVFLRGKGQILWDIMVDTSNVQPMDFLTPGSRDRFDANNKAVDYLFRALCQPEFDRVHTEHLACRILSVLKEAHVRNAQVQARMYATDQREYENFTHLPSESIDALFQRFTVVVNNMRANVDVLSYDDHDRAAKLLHSLDRTIWGGKFEAIVESEKYDTLTVNELFSKLKSAEVDRGMTAKLEGPTDSHSLALVGGSKGKSNTNKSTRMFSLSSLMSMPERAGVADEEVREAAREPGEHEEEHEDMLPVRQAGTLRRRLPGEGREQGRLQAQVEDEWQVPVEARPQEQAQEQVQGQMTIEEEGEPRKGPSDGWSERG
jgi:hypothetical protein